MQAIKADQTADTLEFNWFEGRSLLTRILIFTSQEKAYLNQISQDDPNHLNVLFEHCLENLAGPIFPIRFTRLS